MSWKDFPVVQLKEEVEKQDWYKLSAGSTELKFDEGTWKLNPGHHPKWVKIYLTYRGEQCDIWAGVNFNDEFTVKLQNPRLPKKRAKRPKGVRAACDKICELYGDAIVKLDEEADEKKKEAEKKRQQERARQVAIQRLGVQIQPRERWDAPKLFRVAFSKEYRLAFSLLDSGGFRISEVRGTFTENQIKDLIAHISSYPQIMADRLIQGK